MYTAASSRLASLLLCVSIAIHLVASYAVPNTVESWSDRVSHSILKRERASFPPHLSPHP